ncbi:NUDIX hydrolase [Chromobacterium sp. IIBBL 290-4]|uniref:NUDIX hydrolase n=1 Tax=Chromobacterium sp. IIBBL 290-4 TaxID=2953890 RepID=UPI0020B82B5E|nr:NUDIX domain-containing protein [Chromobacterium sp. IIBBL 290-4]UTH74757.1 NUDIX domain-containing protein [Chromobacterium sp. IIBBL 290-4]
MAFDDVFRLSAHAVITDGAGAVLQLKATYGGLAWGLPGGALEPGETIHECIVRECREELGLEVEVKWLTGVYYHRTYNSQAFIFRCVLPPDTILSLSAEHSAWRFFPLEDLSPVQRQRVEDCLRFAGVVFSASF